MHDKDNTQDTSQMQGSVSVNDQTGKRVPFYKKIPLLDKVTIIVCALIIVLGFSLHLVRVVGDSMSPTYESGNLLITSTHFEDDDIQYGSVVVVYNPEDINKHHLIKRVVGLPGDQIQIKNGYLYRNGEMITEEYPQMHKGGVAEDLIQLSDDEYFVLGDNRNNSTDSRVFGPVERSEITNLIKGRLLSFHHR